MKTTIALSILMFIAQSGYTQKPMFAEPLSPRIANYQINVSLDPEGKKLQGSEVLRWRNTSKDYIQDLQFHLYLNAFKNELSTFMKESGGSHRGQSLDEVDGWGWIEVTEMILNDEVDLTGNMEYIQPDDGNPDDQTVLRILLDDPVKPGEEICLNIEFTARLPEVFARTGYKGDFFMVGQWFPKIGVYEGTGDRYAVEGQWNCHQFHLNSEFFADYGVYEVSITLPDNYVVGATGTLLDEKRNPDNTKSLTYYCEDVHDFAWTADPNYIVIEDQWRHVNIKFLAHSGRHTQVERHIGAAKIALEFFDDWYGPYPYPTLTIVDPRYRAFGAGGMEYPTLITSGSFWMLPDGIRLPELVTIHEFGHNYWYGILGSNEFEEAWLDEGITTYSEIKIMDQYYGQNGGSAISFLGLNIDDSHFQWSGYRRVAKHDAIYKNSWEYYRGGYGSFSYDKPALMLMTLQGYIGTEKMKSVMREYYNRFKFKHPTSRDFIKTVNDITGENYNWYFDQVLYGTNVLDYKIDKISYKKLNDGNKGIFGNPLESSNTDERGDPSPSDSTIEKQSDDETDVYENKIIVAREGEVVFPVEILIKFKNGEEILEKWNGNERYIVYKYNKNSPVVSAEVDPERKVWLDVNFLNNGKTIRSNRSASLKYSTRWLFWMQNFLQFVAIFS